MTKVVGKLGGWLGWLVLMGSLASCAETPTPVNPTPLTTQAATATAQVTVVVGPSLNQTTKLAVGECCVKTMALSPDGKTLALAIKGEVRLWHLDTSRLDPAFKESAKTGSELTGLSWAADGQRLAAGTASGSVLVWNGDGKLLSTINAHTGAVRAVAFAPQENLLASAGADGAVKVWQSDYQLLTTLAGDGQPLNALSWSPDSSQLALAEADTHKIWLKQVNGRTRQVWSDPGGGARALSWSANNSLAVLSNDHHLRLWTTNGKLVTDLPGPVNAITWTPDGRILAGGSERRLLLWDAAGQPLSAPSNTTEAALQMILWLPDAHSLITLDQAGSLTWWK